MEEKITNALKALAENIELINDNENRMLNLLEQVINENEELRKHQWLQVQILKKFRQEIEELK